MIKPSSAFIERYRQSLLAIAPEVRLKVNRPGGLEEKKLLDLVLNPTDYDVLLPNHPNESDVQIEYDAPRCAEVGSSAIDAGQVAYCIMAGGVGTRIGEPKALLRIPDIDMSLLTLKLTQAHGSGPIWIITSPALHDRIVEHVQCQAGIDLRRVRFIEQYESYRLTPDNQISFINGRPETYPCGHGDLFPALVRSKVLAEFLSNGGRYISVVNVDNVMGSLDPVTLGRHIELKANVSCEVVKRTSEDTGGVLCSVNGSLQIVEGFRIHGIDPKKFEWLNTNSFIINANLNLEPLGTAWNRVQKNVDNRVVVQYERLLQEITEAYDTNYLAVEREERFMPIKKADDLVEVGKSLNANRRFF
ncbi:MAG: hypothetical protein FJZ60_00060 [Chlamydiae bacterium]|nr:hypothetical protein [Chlamydiota bacterium]